MAKRDGLVDPTGPRANSNWGIFLSICCYHTRSQQNVNELPARGYLACSIAFHFGLWSCSYSAGWHGNIVRVVAWFHESSGMRNMSSLCLRWSLYPSATFCWQSSFYKLCDAGECTPWLSSGASRQNKEKERGEGPWSPPSCCVLLKATSIYGYILILLFSMNIHISSFMIQQTKGGKTDFWLTVSECHSPLGVRSKVEPLAVCGSKVKSNSTKHQHYGA